MPRLRPLFLLIAVLLTAGAATPAPATAATFTVGSVRDDADADLEDGRCDVDRSDDLDTCTLRAAIAQANASPGADVIRFWFIGAEAGVIRPGRVLPTIRGDLTIDGTSQPGYEVGRPAVTLDGRDVQNIGLWTTGDNVTIRGLAMVGWRDAIGLVSSANHVVAGNVIGLARDGVTAAPNSSLGVIVDNAANVRIGGPSAADRNVVSANGRGGILVFGPGAKGTRIENNRVGTTAAGDAARPNGGEGIALTPELDTNGVPTDAHIADNLVSGNDDRGIAISRAIRTRVTGNVVGLSPAGESLGNAREGIFAHDAPELRIGGATAAERNVVSSNGDDGIVLVGAASSEAEVAGNRIGTSPDGLRSRGNAGSGIVVTDHSEGEAPTEVVIGGNAPERGNLIAGNGGSGLLVGNGADEAVVQNNVIGLDATGRAKLANTHSGIQITRSDKVLVGGEADGFANVVAGNEQAGIAIEGPATGTVIAGNVVGRGTDRTTPVANRRGGVYVKGASGTVVGTGPNLAIDPECAAPCNLIADNGGSGVTVLEPAGPTTVRGNAISGNAAEGIDLGADGVTRNDPGDADAARGGWRNSPVAVLASRDTYLVADTVSGFLDAADPTGLVVDVYAQDAVGRSGAGQGTRHVATEYVKNASGRPRFTVELGDVTGRFYTATVTDQAGNTSEFALVCGGRTPSGAPDARVAPDADGDALCDDWERSGLDVDRDGKGLELPLHELGAQPDEPDVFVEVDYMAGEVDGVPVRPLQESFEQVRDAFADAPGGGVNLHVEGGRHGDELPENKQLRFDGAVSNPNSLKHVKYGDPAQPCDGALGSRFDRDEPGCAQRLLARDVVYRWALFAHTLVDWPSAAGLAGLNEQNLVVTAVDQADLARLGGGLDRCVDVAGKCKSIFEQRVFMHELGHTLGLEHGGHQDENFKPNHLSVMNYSFSFHDMLPGAPLDFSRARLDALDERDLDETKPIVGGQAVDGTRGTWRGSVGWHAPGCEPRRVALRAGVDWDRDGDRSGTSVRASINDPACDPASPRSTLEGSDDWSILDFNARDYDAEPAGVTATATARPLPDGDALGERIALGARADTDEDGVANARDVCLSRPDPEQRDADGDGIGDACLPDIEDRDLELDAEADHPQSDIGQDVTLTLTVRNRWPVAATGVAVRVTPGGRLDVRGVEPDGALDGGRWDVGTVPARGSRTLRLRVRGTVAGRHRTTAEVVAADQPDWDSHPGPPAGEDDEALVDVQIEGRPPTDAPWLDPGFGTGGVLAQRDGFTARGMTVGDDGRAILSGTTADDRFTVRRYAAAGTGAFTFASPFAGAANAARTTADRGVLAAGHILRCQPDCYTQAVVARYVSSGVLDTRVQGGDGFVQVSDPGSTALDAVELPDGDILIASERHGTISLHRRSATGGPRSEFGNHGTVRTWFSTHAGSRPRLLPLPDGDVLIPYAVADDERGGWVTGVARLEPDGDIWREVERERPWGAGVPRIRDAVLDRRACDAEPCPATVVVAGGLRRDGEDDDAILARYTADGALQGLWRGDHAEHGSSGDAFDHVDVDDRGRVIVAGRSDLAPARSVVGRFDGLEPVEGFGEGGFVSTSLGGDEAPVGVRWLGEGRALLGAAGVVGGQRVSFVARYAGVATEEPVVAGEDVSVREGDEGTSTARVTLRLSRAAARATSVAYRTEAVTATAGADFEPVSGVARFAPGATEHVVDVPIRGDRTDEPDEQVDLVLRDPDGIAAGSRPIKVRITDDDAPPPVRRDDEQRKPDGGAGGPVPQDPGHSKGGPASPAPGPGTPRRPQAPLCAGSTCAVQPDGTVTLAVRCAGRGSRPCRGTVTFRERTGRRARLGVATYRAGRGATARVRVRLSARARKALRRKALAVTVEVRHTGPDGRTRTTRRRTTLR